MSLSDVRLRRAGDEDAPWLASLWASAFPGERTAKERLEDLRAGRRHGGLETCWVAERGDERVGGLRSYPFRMALWGRDLDVQGLAAVAIAPEFRRQGLGGLICRQALRKARDEGQMLSVLFPFRVDFYSRMGYTLAGELHRYAVAPEEFPLFPAGRSVRTLPGADATEVVPAFYERVRVRTQGLIRRTPALWAFLREPSTRVVVVPGGEAPDGIRGYLVTEAVGGRVRRQRTLTVREAVVEDLEAHRALMGWIALQRDQWVRVVYDAHPGEHLERILGHPQRKGSQNARPGALWFPSAQLLRGPMLRILDLEAVLSWMRLGPDASLSVIDPVLEENSGEWQGDGAGEVWKGAAPADAFPIALVTELLLDGMLPGQLEAVGDWRPLLGLTDFRLLDTF